MSPHHSFFLAIPSLPIGPYPICLKRTAFTIRAYAPRVLTCTLDVARAVPARAFTLRFLEILTLRTRTPSSLSQTFNLPNPIRRTPDLQHPVSTLGMQSFELPRLGRDDDDLHHQDCRILPL